MTPTPLDIESPASWPEDLRSYLDQHHALFLAWETKQPGRSVQDYDRFIYGLQDLLRRYSLVGWHCTRLTDDEIVAIRSGGMHLPNAAVLERRLDAAYAAGIVTADVTAKLKVRHQANCDNRAGLVWFCFFPPRLAEEEGICRFFDCWGGEALYNSHEGDAETGAALRRIGTPCVVEALVPLTSLSYFGNLPDVVGRRFFMTRGFKTVEPTEYEGAVNVPVSPANIRGIWRFPSAEFVDLTGCEEWRKPINGGRSIRPPGV